MKIRINSLSVRLSIYILGITLGLFILSFSLYFSYTSGTITDEVFDKSNYQVENLVGKIDAVMSRVELSVNSVALVVKENPRDINSYNSLLTNMLKSNSAIVSARIAFEPNYFSKYGRYCMFYTHNADETELIGGENSYDYHAMDWYLIPKLKQERYWSEPYFDAGAGEAAITTYSTPIFDSEGKMIAILAASISLDWITKMVEEEKPYPNSYSYMLSRFAYYISHQDKSKVLNETFFTATSAMKDTTVTHIGYEMLNMKRGHRMFVIDGNERYAFFAPIERIGWSVGIVSSKEDILMQINEVNRNFWILISVSMVLLFVLLITAIRRSTRPLSILTASTLPIANGDFDTVLPDIKGSDEMAELRHAFVNMQHSLKNYIAELQSTTQARERIESELSIATQIQMGMLPTIFPPFPNLEDIDLYATLSPAKEVGGDLYDFFTHKDTLYFTVGDASGKGVPASLLMAVTSSLFRSVAPYFDEPADILRSMNNSIAETNDANMFITLFVGALDIKSGELRYSSAGHNAPVLKRGKEAKFIDVSPNLPLGIMSGIEFESHTMSMKDDEYLFLYSDGLTEAENSDKELYSDERLISVISDMEENITAKELLYKTLDTVHDFVKDNEQSDDLTMLVFKHKK